MKTILIPTDFQIKSLRLVREVLQNNPDEELKIILTHGIYLSNSITDLLFFSKSKFLDELVTEDFNTSCDLIRNTYESQLKGLFIDTFSGLTKSSFQNFLNAHQIDEIYYFDNKPFVAYCKKSFDLKPYILKSKVKQVAIKWDAKAQSSSKESNQLSEIFFIHGQMTS
ncbi:MAG: hypothetical protein HWE21_10905 [Cytophagia bacterium]|nr:hypothetical protein [Cytophagia bacterium]